MANGKGKIYRRADYFKDDLPVTVIHARQIPEEFFPPESANRRQFWKITYIVSGQGELKINRRTYPFGPGFVFLSHPDDPTNLSLEGPIELYNVLFLRNSVEHELTHLYNDNHFFSIFQPEFRPERSINHELLHLIDSNRRIYQGIRRMHYECTHGDANTGDMLRFMVLELLVEFSRQSARFYRTRRRRDAVAHIDRYLREHFGEPCRCEDIADEVGISKGYLFGFYRRVTGRTINETLLAVRIAEARRLLAETEPDIRTVCFRCGFSDVSNFYKIFRRETGVPPGVFRRNAIANSSV